jgi:ABC-type bacteriocin/lantibiotic exporter with double-glycine peptidase domain
MDSITADLTLFPLAGATDEESTGAISGAKRFIKIIARHVNFFYGNHQALIDNNLEIARNRVTAIIGPFGCK